MISQIGTVIPPMSSSVKSRGNRWNQSKFRQHPFSPPCHWHFQSVPENAQPAVNVEVSTLLLLVFIVIVTAEVVALTSPVSVWLPQLLPRLVEAVLIRLIS